MNINDLLADNTGLTITLSFTVDVELTDLLVEGGMEEFVKRSHELLDSKLDPLSSLIEGVLPKKPVEPEPEPDVKAVPNDQTPKGKVLDPA